MEDAGDAEPDPAFIPLSNVLDALSDSTYQQARHAGELWYTHTAAYTVLGIAILDRLTSDQPPLTVEHLVELCREPTVGQLRAALVSDQTPYEIASYLARAAAGQVVEAGAAD